MEITESQFRNLYGLFIIMFSINVGYTIINFHESRNLRLLQEKIAEEQLKEIKKKKNIS